MTAKEKAQVLVEKMSNFSNCWNDDGNSDYDLLWSNAKQCALIAVDEIIKSNPYSPSEFHPLPHFKAGQYWQEVKQEIEKL